MSCVKSDFVKVGTGFYSSKTSASTLCSTLSGTALDACNSCTTAGGYVWIVNNDVCLKCSGVTDATGVAVENGCLCNSGKYFDALKMECVAAACDAGFNYNPNTGACDLCDPVKSVMVGGLCVSCTADQNHLALQKHPLNALVKVGVHGVMVPVAMGAAILARVFGLALFALHVLQLIRVLDFLQMETPNVAALITIVGSQH